MMKSFAKILGVPQEILRAKYFGLTILDGLQTCMEQTERIILTS